MTIERTIDLRNGFCQDPYIGKEALEANGIGSKTLINGIQGMYNLTHICLKWFLPEELFDRRDICFSRYCVADDVWMAPMRARLEDFAG